MRFSVFQTPNRPKPYGVRYWLSRDKPVRKFFASEAEALARKKKLEAAFATGGIAAVQAIDLNVNLMEVQRLADEAGEDVLALVKRALSLAKNKRAGGITLREALDRFMRRAIEVQLRTSTVQFYTHELSRFIANFGAEGRVGAISRESIRRHLDGRPIKSRPHALRAIRAWLRWMLREEPPLIQADPSAGMGIDRPKARQSLSFLNDAQAESLLAYCAPEIKPAVALMLFAGIRVEEIYRETAAAGEDVLRWSDVNFQDKAIHIRPEVAKTRVARTVRNAPENLWSWLATGEGKEGPICAVRLRSRLQAARSEAKIGIWAKSILRHTCASHHVAALGNLSATAILLRHEGDVELLNRRYREGVHITQAAGARFFEIRPVNDRFTSAVTSITLP